ncbi:MAG: hypothetical protein PUP91_35640, partial [Rhizonema sp. PD37]|nr:hypothetical protein [Rhizonema sp. PD37]
MTDIVDPTIDIFIYDLRNGLGNTLDEIEQNKANFRKKFSEYVSQESLIDEDKWNYDAEYLQMLKHKPVEIDLHDHYKGYFYPVLLGDAYGLLIDCAVKNKVDAQPAEYFAGIKTEIERILKGQVGTIGQTWMLSGWLPLLDKNKSHEEIAQVCYKSFRSESTWEEDLDGQGQFLGASIFELTFEPTKDTHWHVIIIISPDEETLNLYGKFVSDWMLLFYYRHKIFGAYSNSRKLNISLQNYFTKIKSGSDSFEKVRNKDSELNTLNQMLVNLQNRLDEYRRDLTILDFQGSTIDINLSNYGIR